MKRLVISGAGGFLGTAIIQVAQEYPDINVVAISSNFSKFATQNYRNCSVISTDEFINKGFDFTEHDIMINCLFPTNADGYKMANGLEKVYKIISAAKDYGVKAFINISSQSVYASRREQAAKEDDELCLENAYAVGKYSSEMFCNQVLKEIPHSNIRLASLLGVGYDQRIVNVLYTCSAVSARFLLAFSFFIASSNVTTPRRIGKNASMPCSLHFLASLSTAPANASTGFHYFFASAATPTGAFPIAV